MKKKLCIFLVFALLFVNLNFTTMASENIGYTSETTVFKNADGIVYTIVLDIYEDGTRICTVTTSDGTIATSIYSPETGTISVSDNTSGSEPMIIPVDEPSEETLSSSVVDDTASINASYEYITHLTDSFYEANDVWTFKNSSTNQLEYKVVYDMVSTNSFLTQRPSDYFVYLLDINNNYEDILDDLTMGVRVATAFVDIKLASLVGMSIAAGVATIVAKVGEALVSDLVSLVEDTIDCYHNLKYLWDTGYCYY